jgi:cardiolipin synthase
VPWRDVFTVKSLFTWPNAVTMIRLCLLPWYVSLVAGDEIVAAGFLLGFLGATDWVDGWLARHFGQVSEFGKILDPIADRVVFLVGIGAVMWHGTFPVWFGASIIAREAAIGAVMVVATLLGMERFDVTRRGKLATFALLCAVPWITLGTVGGVWMVIGAAGWLVGVPGLVLSWLTFFEYLPLVRAHMANGRSRQALPLDE